ncbi:sensor histidine kinase [Paenibacillus sp. GCM10027626]|uniref:sensor histidine kinase n=1 Tax=Paenibacillus sp. GCM10027626 TaxID=3273411 RepID=UPI0036338D63
MNIFLFILMISLIVLLSSVLHSRNKQIRKMNEVLLDIRNGQYNRHIRLNFSNRTFSVLAENLNGLIQDFKESINRAQYLEQVRNQMILNISHDLRTPLTAMLGYIDALQHESGLTEEDRQAYLNILSNKGEFLTRLINDLFELVKLEETKGPSREDRIPLNELVKEEVLQLYHAFTEEGIQPNLIIPEEPIYVVGDAVSLRRALSNLLTNALRYGNDGREIGIRLWKTDNKAWVEIWDRGRGIKPEDLPFVFERLYTGVDSRNTSLQGTGLGLTITKMLIEQHRGNITVNSEPNRKTAFTFCLPLQS